MVGRTIYEETDLSPPFHKFFQKLDENLLVLLFAEREDKSSLAPCSKNICPLVPEIMY